MNIFAISDIHIELLNDKMFNDVLETLKTNIPKDIDCVMLSGDIGKPDDRLRLLFRELKKINDTIFYIPGNHEYYNEDISYTDKTLCCLDKILDSICDEENIIFLQKKCFNYKDLNIIGCTLWSNIHIKDYYSLNDSRMVFNDHKHYLNIYNDHVNWLKNELVKSDKPCIVMTHHLPSYNMVHKRFKFDNHTGFYSCLDDIIKEPIKLWIAGHTHEYINVKINNVQCVADPYGYYKEVRRTKVNWNVIKC